MRGIQRVGFSEVLARQPTLVGLVYTRVVFFERVVLKKTFPGGPLHGDVRLHLLQLVGRTDGNERLDPKVSVTGDRVRK